MRVLCDGAYRLEVGREILDPAGVSLEESAPPWAGDDVVGLVSWEPVTADDLARLPALRVVATYSVGFDHIDVQAATERGVWVCHVPDYCVEEMADHALALLLGLMRGVTELDRSVRDGRWDHAAAGTLRRASDVRLGIVGLGRIGRALARRALALGVAVWGHDPWLTDDEIRGIGATPAEFDELLRACNALSLHAPLTPDTEGLIGRRELALLPEGSYLVNVARGALVDVDAVVDALARGHLAGAALDVIAEHPPPQAPRLVVTPHAGWYSPEAEAALYRRAAASVLGVLEGRHPAGAVNNPDGA
jgi:D-3-phosphoglycerate dehydrogenase